MVWIGNMLLMMVPCFGMILSTALTAPLEGRVGLPVHSTAAAAD
jgi:hypothetical protein